MKFASVQYSKNNIGDVIQILAASRFLPRIDAWCNRENLDAYQFPEPHKIILNGWYQHRTGHFFNDRGLLPLITSMHVAPSKADSFFTTKVLAFLKKNMPVGCRDTYTLNLMKSKGVDAYFSGCLTLTLEPNPRIPKRDYVLCVDVPEAIADKVRATTLRPIHMLNPMWHAHNTFTERLEHAKIYLKKMQQAHCVVTRRLHCALPAVALGTPVVFIADLSYNTVRERCSDYLPFLSTFSEKEFLKTTPDFDSLVAKSTHAEIKSNLIRRCSDFTGFNNTESLIPDSTDDDDIFLLLKSMHQTKNSNRALEWMSSKRLINLLSKKIFNGRRWWKIID